MRKSNSLYVYLSFTVFKGQSYIVTEGGLNINIIFVRDRSGRCGGPGLLSSVSSEKEGRMSFEYRDILYSGMGRVLSQPGSTLSWQRLPCSAEG